MKVAVLTAPKTFRIEETSIPEPAADQVRIRVSGCGVCGSNLPPWEGRPWFKYPFEPGAPGHEGWGVVDAAGSAVTAFKAGDRVAMLSYHAFAEYDAAPQQSVLRLPPALHEKAFPAEPLACAFNVVRRCDIRAGQTVAVVGIGFLGALLVSLAAQAGARVIAISRRPFALNIACEMGANKTIPLGADHKSIVDTVYGLTFGQGCDRVIEAVGGQETLDLAGELTRERGRLVIAGYHQDGMRRVNMQLWNWRGLDVINAHERDPNVYLDGMRVAADTVASGKLDPSPLYTHTFPLERITDAFMTMQSRPATFLKALITL